jgi:N4-gp56 family major capsid protein
MKTSITFIPMILDLFTAYDGGANGSYGVVLNTNTTGSADLSVEMKTFYSDYLIDLAEPELIHDQFGQKQPIPANNGKTIEFRQYDPLPEMTTPLTEGVTPDGQSLKVTNLTATVAQYGGYVTLSDVLLLTAIDNNLMHATKLIASQAGRTLDTITREVINSGTNVQYSDGAVSSRSALSYTNATTNNNITVQAIKKAVRTLEAQDAPKINGYYVGIIHPYVKYDLMNDPEWKYPHQYVDTDNIYANEIGEIAGVRFVQNTRAKKWHGDDLASDSRTLAINYASGYSGAITSVAFDGGTVAEDALIGRYININGVAAKITDNTASSLTFASTNFGSIADNAVISPGEGGAGGVDVYSTLILADDAYGVTEVSGGGLQHIVKQLGSGGTADPLNQRATVGWKAIKTAVILVQQYMVRVETTATP